MSAQPTDLPRRDPDPIVVAMEVLRTPITRSDRPDSVVIDLGQTGGYDPDPAHVYAGVLSMRVPTEVAVLIDKGDGFSVIVSRSDGEDAPSYLDPRFADVAFRNGAAVSQGATAVYDHVTGVNGQRDQTCYWFPGHSPWSEDGCWRPVTDGAGPNLHLLPGGPCLLSHQGRYVRRLVSDSLLNERARQIKTDG